VRLSILAVGRLKSGPERELAEDYLTRIRGTGRKAGISELSISEFAESQAATAAARMAEEARLLWAGLPPKAHTIALDERGKTLSSAEFAGHLARHLSQGTPAIAFLIGGPDGHDAETRARAGLTLSFGPMTWPHRLVRVMLLEQIYRAVTIIVNHPYHRA
jgi:23S rRNA (pseudouridine1915-N3)-methyltransferase